MDNSFFEGLIQNVLLLLVFSFLYDFRWIDSINSRKFAPKLFSGAIVGAIGVLLMNTPWTYAPGIVFDTRSILLSVTGLYLGGIPTLVAMLLTGGFRIFIGGDGLWMGLSVIILSGILGIVLKLYLSKINAAITIWNLLILGFGVHLVMLGCTVFLPADQFLPTLKSIAGPVLLIYPASTVLLGILMNKHLASWQNRMAKDRLIESERRFTEMIKNIKMLSVIIDSEQKITFCNEYLLKVTGYTKEEVIGKNWIDLFIAADEKEMVLATFKNLISGKVFLSHLENRIVTKNKQELVISWNNTILKDSDGIISGTASIGENITEKQIAIQELKKSEDKFNQLFQSSPDAITLTCVKNQHVVEVNDSASVLTGYNKDELIGHPILTTRLWNDERELEEYSELISNQGKVTNYEAQIKTKSGTIKTVLVSGEILLIQDEYYIIGVIRDISPRKETERELHEKNMELQLVNKKLIDSISQLEELNKELKEAKELAEESNRLKSVFLQNISHEIRTPMNGILGFLSLLKDTQQDLQARDQYLEIINKSGERLLNTVNDLIDISRIETKQISINKEAISLSEILHHQYAFYKTIAAEKGLEMKLTSECISRDTIINTDKQLLYSIFSNLLSNAVKFTQQGTIELGSFDKNGSIVFFVKDTGVGIPANRINAIFDRFVQADLNMTRAYEGSGLGLSIAKAYVGLLGGNIWVKSEKDKGSTFFFELPLDLTNRERGKKEKIHSEEKICLKECRILVAEDDEVSFLYLKNLLKSKNMKLFHVINGAEAVEAVRNNTDFCVVLMDIKMPVMSGLEATLQIRNFNKEIPIIAQTAYAMAEDSEKLLSVGFNEYISKPINKEKLLGLIQKHLDKKK
ncbi:PAS domain S-box protein [Prolixibacteraceae bacterium Z1-6]|uniref:histidine kinase n=1 Tax=Draconibacterium aestuarii TaxID=2998507 RepID=A0A9X3J8H4_9BACT|nr:PAS domain S-box protein [Prolixibacteraceae bacterium Z1-6]